MVLHAKTSLHSSPHARTQYLTIPADIVEDSQYPFGGEDELFLYVDSDREVGIIQKAPPGKGLEEEWEEAAEEVIDAIQKTLKEKFG